MSQCVHGQLAISIDIHIRIFVNENPLKAAILRTPSSIREANIYVEVNI